MKRIFGMAMILYGFFALGMEENLALKQNVSASENQKNAYLSVDENIRTHWGASKKMDSWIMVDLGKTTKVGCVIIRWQTQFAEKFSVNVSKDETTFKEIGSMENGKGLINAFGFPTEEVRYVRINLKKPGTKWNGYGIYEIEIYEQ